MTVVHFPLTQFRECRQLHENKRREKYESNPVIRRHLDNSDNCWHYQQVGATEKWGQVYTEKWGQVYNQEFQFFLIQVGNRLGKWSIRINNQWLICFRFEGENAYDAEIFEYGVLISIHVLLSNIRRSIKSEMCAYQQYLRRY